jgi:hypothetical protein
LKVQSGGRQGKARGPRLWGTACSSMPRCEAARGRYFAAATPRLLSGVWCRIPALPVNSRAPSRCTGKGGASPVQWVSGAPLCPPGTTLLSMLAPPGLRPHHNASGGGTRECHLASAAQWPARCQCLSAAAAGMRALAPAASGGPGGRREGQAGPLRFPSSSLLFDWTSVRGCSRPSAKAQVLLDRRPSQVPQGTSDRRRPAAQCRWPRSARQSTATRTRTIKPSRRHGSPWRHWPARLTGVQAAVAYADRPHRCCDWAPLAWREAHSAAQPTAPVR